MGSVVVNRVRVDLMRAADVTGSVGQFLDCGRSHVVHFVSADPTVVALRDPVYRDVLNRGDLNLPDGMSVVWAARLLGRPLPERVNVVSKGSMD